MPKSFKILASFNLSQFLSIKCLPPDIPTPKVCTPADAPTAQTSCVIELNEGALDVGGADLILLLLVLFVVVLEEDPDSYVVAPPVYPPSILVLDPLTLDCEFAPCA